MYCPNHFAETRLDALHGAMEAHPLAALVTVTASGLLANHLPFDLRRSGGSFGFGSLACHVARKNPVWESVDREEDALIVFQGPSAYVSPRLVPSAQRSRDVVPTYNYLAVHAYGRITVHDDPAWVRKALARLTHRFERDRAEPWSMKEAPPEIIEQRVHAVVGIEIDVRRIEGKWKMSQNRSDEDRVGIADRLRDIGSNACVAVAALTSPRR